MVLSQMIFDKLDWPLIVEHLAAEAQTEEARAYSLSLSPALNRGEVQRIWAQVEPLKNMIASGFRPPIGYLPLLNPVLKATNLGQILMGEDFRIIYQVLESTKRVIRFSTEFGSRFSTLARFKSSLYTLPKVSQAIEKAIGPEGELLDDASQELRRIRQQRNSMRRHIESELTKLIRSAEIETYLQDDFFTIRSERYVIPISIDGRGRVKGMIMDTSASGQTLFIEPVVIAHLNEQLLEIYLTEKIEILRIFKELTSLVKADIETLKENYEKLIELDSLTAQAILAHSFGANSVKLVDRPVLNLCNARHPLIKRPDGTKAIANTVTLDETHQSLVISGPNAGGKTVILKTVGLLHLMAKAGLLIPADPESSMFLFDDIFLELGDSQNITANLSTFSGHLTGLKPILERVKKTDLVLLDELAVGTDPQTGSAIAQAVLEYLAAKQCMILTTTHFDALKILPTENKKFRNASMEFSPKYLRPTYKLVLDLPGQSYGLEVAEEIGFPKEILDRAKLLRGSSVSLLDKAVLELGRAKEAAFEMKALCEKEKFEAEAARLRWEEERELVNTSRQKVAARVKEKLESDFQKLRNEFDDLLKKLREQYKFSGRITSYDSESSSRQAFLADRKRGEELIKQVNSMVSDLEPDQFSKEILDRPLPSKEGLKVGDEVFVLPLKKTGTITKIGDLKDDSVEVLIGVVKMRIALQDLRVGREQKLEEKPLKHSLSPKAQIDSTTQPQQAVFFRTTTNTIDLRGFDADDAMSKTWQFIDNAIFRGEASVMLIHGHGTDKLKTTIRRALQHDCPYSISFRTGTESEGGDGVTVVNLRD